MIPNPIETRGSIGDYNPGTGDYTLWATLRRPTCTAHADFSVCAGYAGAENPGDLARHGRRFRGKIFLYYDMALVLVLAKKIGRPVKFLKIVRRIISSSRMAATTSPRWRRGNQRTARSTRSRSIHTPIWAIFRPFRRYPDDALRPDGRRLLQGPRYSRSRHRRLHEYGDGRRHHPVQRRLRRRVPEELPNPRARAVVRAERVRSALFRCRQAEREHRSAVRGPGRYETDPP